jgi:hypothetical protein
MTCCIIMAVILGGLMSLKAWFFCTPTAKAQSWRLSTTRKTQ